MIRINLLKSFVISLLAFILTSCFNFKKEEIIIKDAHLYMPLKGSIMTSGYLSIINNSNKFIEIQAIDCAPFRAEIHETKMTSAGTMKMDKINSFILTPDTNTIFVPGGKHIMFWGLNDYKEEKLSCAFDISDREPINFEFMVLKRG